MVEEGAELKEPPTKAPPPVLTMVDGSVEREGHGPPEVDVLPLITLSVRNRLRGR